MLSMSRDELVERVRNKTKSRASLALTYVPGGDAGTSVENARVIQLNPPAVRVSGPSSSDFDVGAAFEEARIIQLQPFTEGLPKSPVSDADDGDVGVEREQARINEPESASADLEASSGEPEEQLSEREPMLEMCINTLSAQIVELQNRLNVAQRFLSEQRYLLQEERQKSAGLTSEVRALRTKVRSLQQLSDPETEKPWWRALMFAR